MHIVMSKKGSEYTSMIFIIKLLKTINYKGKGKKYKTLYRLKLARLKIILKIDKTV